MASKVKTFIIKATNNGFYLNDIYRVERRKSNIGFDLVFATGKNIFWSGHIIHLNESGVAFVKITELNSPYARFHKTQKLSREIKYLHLNFDSLAESEISSQFSNFDWEVFNSSLKQPPNIDRQSSFINKVQTTDRFSNSSQQKSYHEQLTKKFEFSVNIESSKLSFHCHFVRAKIKLKESTNEIIVDIQNQFIQQEFEYIKPYFIQKLGKTITVTGSANKLLDKIEIISASSDWVNKINSELIDSVKLSQIDNLLKKTPLFSNIKALFTDEEIHDSLDEKNIFNLKEKDLLQTIIQKNNIRNKEQINYLANNLQDTNEKIRFTLAPNFGFLFCIRGKKGVHYCLELLNSHATYVWSFPMQIGNKRAIEFVEKQVVIIKEVGRQKYRANYIEDSFTEGFEFNLITHPQNESTSNSMAIWSNKLKSVLG